MAKDDNPHLKTHRIEFPEQFLEMIRKKAEAEDEFICCLIRRVMAEYVGWTGPIRIVKGYEPSQSSSQPE